ncbi:hypothetical protein STEG23_022656, partial [Scotinomys teguina]
EKVATQSSVLHKSSLDGKFKNGQLVLIALGQNEGQQGQLVSPVAKQFDYRSVLLCLVLIRAMTTEQHGIIDIV